MKYIYKPLDIETYTNLLYQDGLKKTLLFDEESIIRTISLIGLFKFKGYVKAFRNDLSNYSIDDILFLYDFDRELSSNTFKLISSIEIKIKAYLIESIYDHRLLDVYYTLYFLLSEEKEFENSNDLENRFIIENFKSENLKMQEFILNCMRKR